MSDFSQFIEILNSTADAITSAAKRGDSDFLRVTGDTFEPYVAKLVSRIIDIKKLNIEVKYTEGSHIFPDIVLVFSSGKKYGIEVKCTVSKGKGWKINGNSVMGSTKEPNVEKTYILFGKLVAGQYEVRTREYEKCVADVVVTHSPRYKIDMDIAEGDTFFDKSKISYKEINDSKNPIGLITDYFSKTGASAWWLSVSSPAAVKQFSNLDSESQKKLIAYGFVHFPELFSNSRTKFQRLVKWLVMEQSISDACIRDKYTAGGKVTIGSFDDLPRIMQRLIDVEEEFKAELSSCDSEQLNVDWGEESIPTSLKERIEIWREIVAVKITSFEGKSFTPLDVLKSIMH